MLNLSNAVVIIEIQLARLNGPFCLDSDGFRLVSDIVMSTAAVNAGDSAVC